MRFIDNFSNCNDNGCLEVFRQHRLPVFQNKVYATPVEAGAAEKGGVLLMKSKRSGFVFNHDFNPGIMNYDQNYHNEQSNSLVFKNHLTEVLELLKSFGIKNKKVVEVGSGKGIFFEMMMKEGIDCYGFDPAYEGDNPRITKDYFSNKYNGINAGVIIMRHTLEHIPNPFSFIHTLAAANNYQGHLFIEVPTFDWIKKKEAFWDIFYEHCNYFTEETLSVMFKEAKTGDFFGGQYIFLWADLKQLQNEIPARIPAKVGEGLIFERKINFYSHFLKTSRPLLIWGAGAKGSTFLNLLDPDRNAVSCVVDINPAKQNRYIGGTGHKICSPEVLDTFSSGNILVMNENYLAEIRNSIKTDRINLFHL
jgi:hypothetical protein